MVVKNVLILIIVVCLYNAIPSIIGTLNSLLTELNSRTSTLTLTPNSDDPRTLTHTPHLTLTNVASQTVNSAYVPSIYSDYLTAVAYLTTIFAVWCACRVENIAAMRQRKLPLKYVRRRTHIHTHTYVHTYTHTYTYTHTRTHSYTHTHTHTLIPPYFHCHSLFNQCAPSSVIPFNVLFVHLC